MKPVLDAEALALADRRVRRFREQCGLRTAPVDCYRLLKLLDEKKICQIRHIEDARLERTGVSFIAKDPRTGGFLLFTGLYSERWKNYSPRRRINFTLAHEIGHCACGHLEVPPGTVKSKAVEELEDLEADAFAARLLMPAEVMGFFCSVKEAADTLLVSESAVRVRLMELNLLYAIRTCPDCGLSRIPPAARFCRRCGRQLKPWDGPLQEPEVTLQPLLPRECPICGSGEYGVTPWGTCWNCDNPKQNYCLPEYNQPGHPCPKDAKYCEICGAPTYFRDFEIE